MSDWIYCGSDSAVGAIETQNLLSTHEAIWCSPPGLRPWPGVPQPGERLWLVWRESENSQTILLLGGGILAQSPRNVFGTNLLWTEVDSPGIRTAAVQLGYEGPTSMSFLRLSEVVLPIGQPAIQGLVGIPTRLSEPTPAQLAVLLSALQIG